MASPRFFRGLFTLTFPSSNTAPGRIAGHLGLFLLRFRIVPVFFPGGNAAADMPLGFIHFQHMPDASVQLRVHRLKAVGHVFMYRGLGYMKLLGGRPDCGVVFDDILAQLNRSFFYSSFHTITP